MSVLAKKTRAPNAREIDGPWELPAGWAWTPLGKLGRWTGGGTPSKSNDALWSNGTVPWVSPKDMKIIVGERRRLRPHPQPTRLFDLGFILFDSKIGKSL